MAKGPIVTPEVIGLIASVHGKHTKWKAPMVRNEVEDLLRRKNPDSPRSFPSLSTVQKVLATVRRKENELLDSDQDKPWNLDSLKGDSLKGDSIPPEVLPKLFPIWLKKQEDPLSPPLTIREARWIVQLSSMTEDTERLGLIAEMCAEWELIGELTNTPQLSSPATILYIYSRLTRMPKEAEKEHYQAICREKHVSVSDSRREKTIRGLQAIYGDEFPQATKLKSKKGKGGTK